MLNNIYHWVLFHSQAFSRAVHHCPEEFVLGYIIILMYRCNYCIKTFLYDFHANKLNSMYYSNWFVMSYILFLACFTKCSVKCKHWIRVTFKRNVSMSSKKIRYSHKISFVIAWINYIFKYFKIENCYNISQYYCFCSLQKILLTSSF